MHTSRELFVFEIDKLLEPKHKQIRRYVCSKHIMEELTISFVMAEMSRSGRTRIPRKNERCQLTEGAIFDVAIMQIMFYNLSA